ncbi:MAG TPA: hypothetical protein DCG69_11775 [Bacteroidales bacterium]|nr:hypothetical protein [Bacteroidales bacterium]
MMLLEILKFILPSLVVFFTAYFVLKQVFDKHSEQQQNILIGETKKENVKLLTPLRLQAYERMVLYLERIAPANLILRQNQSGLTVFQLQTRLIQSIREEFEHNLSQQLYISSSVWDQIANTKEEVVRLINTSASQLKSDDASLKLGQLIINTEKTFKKPIVRTAIENLKAEMEQKLG